MEPSSHMSVILDLSPTQWHLSSLPKNAYPLTFRSFLSQILAFLNSFLALKVENTIAVWGALPGKRWVVVFRRKKGLLNGVSLILCCMSYVLCLHWNNYVLLGWTNWIGLDSLESKHRQRRLLYHSVLSSSSIVFSYTHPQTKPERTSRTQMKIPYQTQIPTYLLCSPTQLSRIG